jgi:hypothetical protein
MAGEAPESAQPPTDAADAVRAATASIDVFISYASPDSAVAESVCESLERAGIICWIAPRDVTPGSFYANEIVHALDAAKTIVLILSQNAAASPHVLREIERATSKRRPVVSLLLRKGDATAALAEIAPATRRFCAR